MKKSLLISAILLTTAYAAAQTDMDMDMDIDIDNPSVTLGQPGQGSMLNPEDATQLTKMQNDLDEAKTLYAETQDPVQLQAIQETQERINLMGRRYERGAFRPHYEGKEEVISSTERPSRTATATRTTRPARTARAGRSMRTAPATTVMPSERRVGRPATAAPARVKSPRTKSARTYKTRRGYRSASELID